MTFRPQHVWLVSCCRVVTALAAAARCAPKAIRTRDNVTSYLHDAGSMPSCNALQWLSRVKIFTSPNNVDWIDQGSFAGSSDQDSLTNIIFPRAAVCRYVRLEVVSVSGHASARWDVLKSADQNSLALDQPALLRANPSISQYAFSSCHAGDAPGNGHCRPQIDSAQVSCC